MEQRMSESDSSKVNQRSPATVVSPAAASPVQMDQVVVPSLSALQGASHIQEEVDRHIKHLTDLNDTVSVKRQLPWPQNFVLGK